MEVRLVAVSGKFKARELLVTLPAVLGRGREATVRVPHALISRKHCQLIEANGYVVVQDMGSLNGTYIDNRAITEAVLPPGGLLTLGSLTFRAEYKPTAEPAPTTLSENPAAAAISTASAAAPPPPAVHPPGFEDFEAFELVDFEEDDQRK